jgi:hypothetical protein
VPRTGLIFSGLGTGGGEPMERATRWLLVAVALAFGAGYGVANQRAQPSPAPAVEPAGAGAVPGTSPAWRGPVLRAEPSLAWAAARPREGAAAWGPDPAAPERAASAAAGGRVRPPERRLATPAPVPFPPPPASGYWAAQPVPAYAWDGLPGAQWWAPEYSDGPPPPLPDDDSDPWPGASHHGLAWTRAVSDVSPLPWARDESGPEAANPWSPEVGVLTGQPHPDVTRAEAGGTVSPGDPAGTVPIPSDGLGLGGSGAIAAAAEARPGTAVPRDPEPASDSAAGGGALAAAGPAESQWRDVPWEPSLWTHVPPEDLWRP